MKAPTNGWPLQKIAIRVEQDIVTARQRTRQLSKLLGFDNQDQVRIATAVSELVRNVFQYAGSGTVEFIFRNGNPQEFVTKVSDSGSGIADLEAILAGSYQSPTGMGVGIIGTKKLMDSFEVASELGKGTIVTIGKFLAKTAKRIEKSDLTAIVDELILKHPANALAEVQDQNRDLLLALAEVRTAKDELIELNKELAETNRGVVALYAELDEKAASLQKANEIKTSFLSNMTHEFRTPLSSVISLTRMLLAHTDGDLTTEQRKQVNYIRQSSESLLELVSDLLDIAKVEAGKITVRPTKFGIDELLGGLRGMFRPILNANSNIEFIVEDPPYPFDLTTDQPKLAQILRNLVSNAIKFTESGSVTVRVFVEDHAMVRISVVDTGAGIEDLYKEVVFDDFGQVESILQRKQKGTGLGLPLSRKLARLLGGEIWLESTVGVGSTFHLAIPLVYEGGDEGVLIQHSPQKMDPPAGRSEVQSDAKFRVLIIDDDEPSRYVLKNMIGAEIDATFIEASNGRLGLECIRRKRPDVVFLDLTMPEMDGLEVLGTTMVDQDLLDIPIVINTAKALSREERERLGSMAIAVLSKDRTNDKQAVLELQAALAKAGFDYR